MKEQDKKLIKLIPELYEIIEKKLEENGIPANFAGAALSAMLATIRAIG